ncbi:peptidase inhibitor 15-like [Liolophura sinensis]|uniref:peptidase inhibitor 15-like n=1 Tax=Liolophura sinensis TaxID=3198878 RepID=UPI003158FC79
MLIGQNIVAGYIDKDVKDVDKELMIRLNKYYFDEIKYYTYPEPDCMGDHECNHYRVMMIAASTKIGGACGICDKVWRKTKEVEDLSQKDKNVVFCVNNYDKPLSSISGIKLFEKGPPCSACPLNWAKCVNKLCVACKEGEDGCKHFDNCKDISTAATCNYVKSKKLCEGYKGNCAKTCDAC